MGARIRAMDWSRTPLGPLESWPQSLRSAVSILLPSKAQIALVWGEQFITLYNDAYRPVFGAKHPDALGQPISEAWDELWRNGLDDLFAGVVRTGDAFWARDRVFFMERYGYLEETYFDVSYDPVRDESGRVGGLFCIVSETTGRVIGERRLRTLKDLAQVVQHAHTVEEVYRLSAESLCKTPQDVPFALAYGPSDGHAHPLLGHAGLALPHSAAPELLVDAGDAMWPVPEELVVLDDWRAGSICTEPWPEPLREVAILPITVAAKDERLGYLVLGISPRRRIDDDYRDFLRLAASTIASAVISARRSEDERRRAESLAELDRAKTTFFTNISHEFRTPLSLLLGPIEEGLKVGALTGEELQLAYRNGQRLMRLVNALLDFARIQAGRLKAEFVPVDLVQLTRDLVSLFRSAAERAGLTLSFDGDLPNGPVQVDVEMYEKIVSNLLSNAIKFTAEGGVTVSLCERGDAVELQVSDSGVGIAESELPRIFDRFHRIDDSWSRTQEGSGIGLALLRDLVRLHGGTVTAHSEPGTGTTITVSLPRQTVPQVASGRVRSGTVGVGRVGAALADEAARWTRPVEGDWQTPPESSAEREDRAPTDERILVVDDNEDMRNYLARLLGGRWRVRTAGDGVQALEAVAQEPADLIVSDVMMPRMDGFGLIAALRGEPTTRAIPIILVSARAGEEARIEALHAGADDHVVKPFSARELVARVESQLLRRRLGTLEHEQAQRLAEVFEQAPVGIAILQGPSHRFAFVNDRYLQLIDRRSVLGLAIREALPELEGQGIYELLDQVYETGSPYLGQSIRLMLDDVDGVPRERYFDFVYQPTLGPDRKSTGIAVVVYDVTALSEARREADRANRAKDEFLAMLSHELRNPLSPILTVLQVMRMSGSSAFEKERAVLQRQTDHLVRLVSDLMDVSRIASGKVELRKERIDLRQVLDRAIETARPALEAKRHQLRLDLDRQSFFVLGDAIRLAQVVSNLLINAAKYTPEGGNIELSAHAAADGVEVRVRDDGVGISAENLPHVFDLFMQERQTIDRATGGLGLGLAIVKSLVEAHGGWVSARSDGAGRGSEFTIVLPLLEAHAADAPETPSAVTPIVSDAPRTRVLIVDDNPDVVQTLAQALELYGFQTRVAFDGPSAIECAEAFRPEVAILDIGLPVMDGNELAANLRARYPSIRTVAVTGYGRESLPGRPTDDHFSARLLKPVDVEALLSVLKSPTG